MFENILGNENIKKELEQVANNNINSHSYLFIGTDGIGKFLIAKEFAKMLLCLDVKKYCNKCKSCLEFNSENNPDFFVIEPDGNSIKIEQIREMQRKLIEEPIVSEKKVYIINNSDKMTKESQNALLKTLEEPPSFVVIILVCSNINNMLTTIKSRCNIIKFQDISNENIKKYFEEKYEMKDIAKEMLMAFGGSIGKAEILKEKQELYSQVFDAIENIENRDLIDFLRKAEVIYSNQDDKMEILEYINVLLFQKAKTNVIYTNCVSIVENTKERLKANGNFNMCIDNMLFNIWEEVNFEKYSRN